MQTILVTDETDKWQFLKDEVPIVSAYDYLSQEDYYQNQHIRVINLCKTYNYQKIGYYVSLLAQARDHKAIPRALNIQDVLSTSLSRQISHEIDEEIQQSLRHIKGDEFVLTVYFGQNITKQHANLAKKLHGLFPLPLLKFTLERKKIWQVKNLVALSIDDIPKSHLDFFKEVAKVYFSKKRFHQWRRKQRFHDLAILLDNTEPTPPSNKKAIEFFVNAGEELGLNIDLIDKSQQRQIGEYDALFIRATTAVEHYTYRLARRAHQENLVVIDDPQSIVKCTNKVYLAELLQSHNIITPKTTFISKYSEPPKTLKFPCVLKIPDSAFSQGVTKVENKDELEIALASFFKNSDLVLAQPFLPTEFDWRIGILDNKPIFACKYFMAKDHWQIYNWDSKKEFEGDGAAVKIEEVPEKVIKVALKATKLIGNGLYGVDIKTYNDKHYIIEVNDNPNIDWGMEDQVLGGKLYFTIMEYFLKSIRRKHGYV